MAKNTRLVLSMMINYAGRVELSTIDWFGHAAYVIFLNGCPMKCPRCHNAQIRNSQNLVELNDVVSDIRYCGSLVNHVVISGGEPLAQPDTCRDIIQYCHELSRKVAVETSGCFPLVPGFDAVFLDIKTSLERGVYDSYTGFPGSFDSLMSNLARMDPVRDEIRIVLFPDSNFDVESLGALRGFPVRISIGRGMGDGVVSQEQLMEFGFKLYEYLGYSSMTIETGRLLMSGKHIKIEDEEKRGIYD
jgi:pyruvate formate lyase activating enzyme